MLTRFVIHSSSCVKTLGAIALLSTLTGFATVALSAPSTCYGRCFTAQQQCMSSASRKYRNPKAGVSPDDAAKCVNERKGCEKNCLH